jgi:hypothetical protein
VTASNPPICSASAPSDCKNAAVGHSEQQLELAIAAAMARLCAAPTRAEKLREWREMCRLIDQRTHARQRFMARVQGLA